MPFKRVQAWLTSGKLLEVPVDAADLAALRSIVNTERGQLEQYNCARYSLARGMTQR